MRKLLVFILLVAGIVGGGFWAYGEVKEGRIRVNDWFVGGMTRGVDVSSYQTDVDFGELKNQGIEFAFIKATEGSSHVDASFAKKWQDAEAAGMPAGAYHYFSYHSSGATQATNYIKTVGDLSGRLLPAVDMELTPEEVLNPPEKEEVVRGLRAFLAIIEDEYKVKPIIYSRQDYYEKYLAEDFSDYPRWITNVFFPVFVEAGDNWAVWQYNDRGGLDGYGGEKYIDLNVLNKKTKLEDLTVK